MKLLREVEEQVNRPFSEKLLESQGMIARNLMNYKGRAGIAFSGGKDSEVVLYLCRQLVPEIPVVFNNTGVEYPETVDFIKYLADKWGLNLIVTHPQKTFWDCVDEWGFPEQTKRSIRGKPSPHCCYWLKEKPMRLAIREHGLKCYFAGVTAVESWNRMFNARDKGMCFHLKKWNIQKVYPILWWTEKEVWQFIEDNNLPVNEIYQRGAYRVGCMPCTAYKTWEDQLNRLNPKLYRILKLRKDGQYAMPL